MYRNICASVSFLNSSFFYISIHYQKLSVFTRMGDDPGDKEETDELLNLHVEARSIVAPLYFFLLLEIGLGGGRSRATRKCLVWLQD